MTGPVLTLNAGSSSIKFAVFEGAESAPRIAGKIAGIGGTPVFSAHLPEGALPDPGALAALDASADHETVIARLLPWLSHHLGPRPLGAVGHRVVHGGPEFTRPTRITETVLETLETFSSFAPLHQPHNIAAIRAVGKWAPGVPQVACFDTSFHRGQDRLMQLFAVPLDLTEEGILRYGFHGLSYEHIASVLPAHLGERASGRVVVAHLGNGASMCAMRDRRSVATTMGFTALDGLMMGRRCGSLDPGIVLYLMRQKGMSAEQIETLLYKKSGLLGVSGLTNDMQCLEASGDPRAKEAIDLYCYRAACGLAGLLPAIGGLDALVFTAGIGENSPLVRRSICRHLDWLGIGLDEAANARGATEIGAPGQGPAVLVIPTNEEAVVARACRSALTCAQTPD